MDTLTLVGNMSTVTNGLNFENYPERFQRYMTDEVEAVKQFVKGTGKVLEVGFGKGRIIPEIQKIVGNYYGIDIDKDAFDYVYEKFSRSKNIHVELMDIADISNKYKENFFDRSICLFNTIGVAENPDKMIENIITATKDSFLITLQSKGALKYRTEYYKKLGIQYSIDAKTESIFSDIWGVSRAYSKDDIQYIAKRFNVEIIQLELLRNLAYLVIFKK